MLIARLLMLLGVLVVVTFTPAAAQSQRKVTCDAIQCWGGRYSYEGRCGEARERYERHVKSCEIGGRSASYQQCLRTAEMHLDACTCAKNCGQAVCTRFAANDSDRCTEATWRRE